MSSKITTCMTTGLMLAACSSLAFAEDVTLDVVTQAWKQTQEKVRSATFQWETRKWMASGTHSGSMMGMGPPVAEPAPDITHTYKRTLVINKEMVRFENSGPHWDPLQERWLNGRQINAWDGTSAVRFNGHRQTPDATIHDNSMIALGESDLRPIQMTFRMDEPSWYVFQSENFEISPSSDTVDGAPCWNIETARRIIREKVSKGRRPLKAVYTICPARNYAVVRYAAIDDSTGVSSSTIEIDHAWDEKTGVWVPSEWTITQHGKQGPRRTETSSVRRYSLNEAVGDETFVVDLPVGTLVSDMREAENGESDLYVLRKGDEKREITREERFRPGVTRQELLRTESGMAGLRKSEADGIFSSPVTYAWIFGVLLLAAAAGLAIRNQLRT